MPKKGSFDLEKNLRDVAQRFRAISGNVDFIDVLASCIGILYAVLSLRWFHTEAFDGTYMHVQRLLMAARIALYLALPFVPVAVAYAICAFNLVVFAVPLPGNGMEYIGTCYALALLAWRGSRKRACACLCIVLIGTVAITLLKSDGYVPNWLSWLAGLAPYCIALFCGLVVREWQNLLVRQRLAEREIAYRKEQLRMVHTLHDSVANTLSYAVLLCRGRQDEHDEQIERLLEQSLKTLRSDVIAPVTNQIDVDDDRTAGASMAACLSDANRAGDSSCMDDVRAELRGISDRLAALGFTGEAIFINRGGDPVHQWSEMVCGIVRELGSNIAKHAAPGDYALTVVTDDGRTTIMSNACADDRQMGGKHDEALSSGFGLGDLLNVVHNAGGTAEWCCEDGEWSIAIELPWIKV